MLALQLPRLGDVTVAGMPFAAMFGISDGFEGEKEGSGPRLMRDAIVLSLITCVAFTEPKSPVIVSSVGSPPLDPDDPLDPLDPDDPLLPELPLEPPFGHTSSTVSAAARSSQSF